MRLALVAAVGLAVAAPPASATMPPRTCGFLSVHGTSYKVRAHVVACRHARRHARRVLAGRSGPRGWSCRRFSPSVTRIRFTCQRGARDFYAIRQ